MPSSASISHWGIHPLEDGTRYGDFAVTNGYWDGYQWQKHDDAEPYFEYRSFLWFTFDMPRPAYSARYSPQLQAPPWRPETQRVPPCRR